MKIGILTFHAQRNYGGVLQAWALQTAIERLGYDAVVIDRQITRSDHNLQGPGFSWPVRGLVSYVIRFVLGIANTGLYRRCEKTRCFLRKFLHLTPYRFFDWKDFPENHGLDAIVVGSDQVWHLGKEWGDPRPYFLMGAPRSIPAISYAASFGMKEIPPERKNLYKDGFGRFSGLSVREHEGVRLVEACGYAAEHVVDPTLLVDSEEWKANFCDHSACRAEKTLVFYIFEAESADVVVEACKAARMAGWKLHVLVNENFIRMPRSFKSWLALCQLKIGVYRDVVSIDMEADPRDFVNAFAQADAIVTDSFHGLMFATLFGKNVRILRPRTSDRKGMQARICEFVANDKIWADSILCAVRSVIIDDAVVVPLEQHRERIEKSRKWLAAQLERCARLGDVSGEY